MKRIFQFFLVFSGIFFFFLMLKITIPYFSFRYDVDFLLTKMHVIHIPIWRIAFYTHIGTSLFVLLTGVFQFVKPLMIQKPAVHRLLGKIDVGLVIFISAPSGLVMAFYANGGVFSKMSFVIISILWWYFTFTAYRKAVKRELSAHLAFMYRSYALTLSAITLRTYVLIFPYFFHLHAREMYTLVAWLSWIPNLLIAEFLIRKQKMYTDVLVR